jgi:ABC-type Fe3+-citrate transport system substrate-binding protein
MKKFLAVVMTAVLAMSMMTACGSSKSSKENKDTTAAIQGCSGKVTRHVRAQSGVFK